MSQREDNLEMKLERLEGTVKSLQYLVIRLLVAHPKLLTEIRELGYLPEDMETHDG